MKTRNLILIASLALAALACRLATDVAPPETPTQVPPTPLPAQPVLPGELNPAEPVFIIGTIPYSSPFFVNSLGEPFVLLEDQTGFIHRDREFTFSLASQAIGPVIINPDNSLSFQLALPAVPQGTMTDLDQDDQVEPGVQVFAVAFWSNTWGDPFLERRDGGGWSTAYASTRTDPENKDEIVGGTLILWAPDGEQSFPSGFGADQQLFTADDPVQPVPAGYSIVSLDQEPFRVYKEARPSLVLYEGEVALNDYSELSYQEAFDKFFTKAAREYPFTTEKNIDWSSLYDEIAPQVARARNDTDFYKALRQLMFHIPDGHFGINSEQIGQVFYDEGGGSFGMVLAELTDGRVLVSQVLPGLPAERANILSGAEILVWDGQPVKQAIAQVTPPLETFSTEHARRLNQVIFLTRVPDGTRVSVEYRNPGASIASAELKAVVEYDSLFAAIPSWSEDVLGLPVQGQVLEESLGYIRVTTFSDDYNLIAQIWDRLIAKAIEEELSGLIIDLRSNGGGSGGLSLDFAGYFFDQELLLGESYYFSERLGDFESTGYPTRLQPGPRYFDGPIAVLIGPGCASACEGLAYAMQQQGRATIIGHAPTAGMYGEVGRGQYKLPGGIDLQIPTGRSLSPDGTLIIEGVGVIPDIVVPVDAESVLGQRDSVLDAAIQFLQK